MKKTSYLALLGLLLSLPLHADRIYVSSTAAEGGDGTSWTTAYRYLQDGLKDAKNDDNDEIWVTGGTYYPDEGSGETDGDREAVFFIRRSNTVYGGFAGTETSLEQRDIQANVTVLSGKLTATKAEWSRHVTKIANATIDGITITGGNADGTVSPDNEGGAIDASGTNVARNCIFTDNSAKIGGVAQGGTWTFTDCTFSDNEATEQGGVASGGTWTVSDSTFLNNSSPIGGVAFGGTWNVTDCEFTDNDASTQGGVANNGTWTVSGGTFSGNSSPQGGVSNGGTWDVTDTIFSENDATTQGGVANSGTWTVQGDSMFSKNTAPSGGVANNSIWTVTGAVFSENEGTTEGGVADGSTWVISNTVFSKNKSPLGGVGKGVDWNVKNSLFEENESTADGGVGSTGTWVVANSYFVSNSADRGAIANQGTWTVANSVFVENTAIDRGGIARASDWTVTNSTFFKNTAGIGGIARGGTWLATNNIFFENGNNPLTPLTSNSATYEETPTPGKERAKNILDYDWTGGDMGDGFLINEDPLFIDKTDPNGADDTWGTADDGLRLLTGSPAIGEGNTTFQQADTQDLDGDDDLAETTPLDAASFDRILDTTLDLGAYEYVEPPNTLTITISPANTGTVSDTGNGNGKYEDNATATLTATPAEGYMFDHWEGAATGISNPTDIVMDGDKSVTAVFIEIPPNQVTLTTTVDPADSGSVDESGDGTYEENTTATLEAIPADGFAFDKWEGDLTGSDNPDDLLMDANKSVTAVFIELPKTLTTLVTPLNTGIVTQSGSGSYDPGTTATIEAVPSNGFEFLEWEGDIRGTDNPIEVTMDTNKSVTAVFVELPSIMTLSVSPNGSGSVNESGSGSYVKDSIATLEAVPSSGYRFDRWEGDASGSDNPLSLTMNSDKDVTAVFELITYSLSTNVSPAATGSVTESGDGTYLQGAGATVTATPAEGYLFERWEGALNGTGNPAELTMDEDKTVTAVFALIPPDYNLATNVSPNNGGTITESGDGTYVEGTIVTLSAFPAGGFLFDRWEGSATGSTNPIEVTMDADKTVTAVFVEAPPDIANLTTSVSPADSGTVTDNGGGAYVLGGTATVTAVPGDDYLFDHWEGAATGSDNPIEIVMNSDKQVTAVFVEKPPEIFTLISIASPELGGTVTDNGEGSFEEGTTATVEAIPAEGYQFDNWEGDAEGSENPLEVLMDENKEITAVFSLIPPSEFKLTTSIAPADGGTVDGNDNDTYLAGSSANIEAIPAPGYLFESWNGDTDSNETAATILMDADKTVTAIFVKDESDADFDGLTAFEELSVYGSNPNDDDTDGDGIKDGVEAGTIFNPAVDDSSTLQLLASNPEFYLGLVLASSAIVPEILIEKNETDDFMITIQIQKTDNLKDWSALDLTDAVIDGDTITVTIPASETIRFIRSRTTR